IKFIQQDPEIFRVYGLDGFLYPNASTTYRLHDVGFLNAVVNVRYIGFSWLIRFYVGFFDGLNVSNVESRFFSFLNLKYVATAPGTPPPAPFFTRVYQLEANVYRNEQRFPRAFIVHRAEILPNPEAVIKRLTEESFDLRTQVTLEEAVEDPARLTGYEAPLVDGSTAEIVSYGPTRVVIRVHMEHAGFLVLSDSYFPGWLAFVNGMERKIYLTNYFIRSVFLDRGVHTVEFVYQPVSYKLGAWLTLLGCGVVVAIFSGRFSARRWKLSSSSTPISKKGEGVKSLTKSLKRKFSFATLWVAGGFVLVILLFFYDVLFLGYTLLASGPPTKIPHVIDPSASSHHHEPLIQFTSKTYKQGLIPLWNPHSAVGT
ncbi:MAG: YfhO family protein, partial [Nitrospira sp.]|nr:YfhO family protein [Nitrospira sp.]